jgi:hypothetical protein
MAMAARNDHLPSPQELAEEFVIREALKEDPDHVLRVVAEIVERMKAAGRYTEKEIEAAAAHLCRELGIPPSVN